MLEEGYDLFYINSKYLVGVKITGLSIFISSKSLSPVNKMSESERIAEARIGKSFIFLIF